MASTDATPFPVKNQAYRVTFPILDADGDLVTGATGLDSEVSKDAGTFADCTNEATEIATSSGVYYLDLTATEMNADTVAIIVKTTSTGAKTTVLVLYPQADGLDRNVNVTHWNGTAVATPATAGYPAVTIKSGTGTGEVSLSSGTVTVGTNSDKTGYSLTATTGLGNQTANITGNLSGSVGSVTGAVGSVTGNVGGNVTGSVGSVLGGINTSAGTITTLDALDTAQDSQHATTQSAISALNDPTAAAIADAVWDEVITGAQHNVNNSAAKFLRESSEANALLTGTTQAGTSTTITLESGAVAANDILNGERIAIIEGTGVGQSRLIIDSVVTTDVVTVAHAWVTNPDSTSVYAVMGAESEIRAVAGQTVSATGAVDFDDLAAIVADTNELQTDWANGGRLDLILDARASQATADAIEADTQDIQSRIPAALVGGRIDATVDATGMETGAIDAILTRQMTESYAADGAAPTLAQALMLIQQQLGDFSISGTTMTVRKVDGSTTAATFTLNDGTSPTGITRAT